MKDITEVIVRELSSVDEIDPTFDISPDRNNIYFSTWKGAGFEIEVTQTQDEDK
ncbi:MAG: hypothetical protein ACXAEN_18510 [Candidatus Thorarchaeota archaeon]